jgi:drug/metabolite transporter (DMT)-like permease
MPLIRLSGADIWTTLAARSLLNMAAAFLFWLLYRAITGQPMTLIGGRIGLIVGFFYALGTLSFVAALYHTTTANVAFILAFNPMFGALLAWIFLKQVPRAATLWTMAIMIAGVALIVSDGLSSGHLFGDAMALGSAFFIAIAITISTSTNRDLGFAPLISTYIPALIGLAMISQSGWHMPNPGWLVFDGFLVNTIAFWCLATGPRFLPAPVVGMFYLLETVLAPIWVWLLFDERISTQSLFGGTILIVALVAHSIWMMRGKA